MRETRVLIVTLMHRYIGPAVTSWFKALRYADQHLPTVRFDHYQMHGNPLLLRETNDGHTFVVHKYREAQEVFRAGPWWALLALEDDMIIPPDGLVRLVELLSSGADVGYGLYVWRHGSARWSAYTALDAKSGRSLSDDPDDARAAWGTVVDVKGVGMGCTIIKRPALEALTFRRGGLACNDWYFALDAARAGYVQRADLGLVCGHFSLEPSPRIWWPDPDQPELYRIEPL